MTTGTDGRMVAEGGLKRNPLSVRWADDEHRTLVDEAWRRRMSASELVRRYVIDGLRRDGVMTGASPEAGAALGQPGERRAEG